MEQDVIAQEESFLNYYHRFLALSNSECETGKEAANEMLKKMVEKAETFREWALIYAFADLGSKEELTAMKKMSEFRERRLFEE